MGRDILSFSEPVPSERIGLGTPAEPNRPQHPDDSARVDHRPPPRAQPEPAPVDPEPSAQPTEMSGRGRLYAGLTAVGLLLAGAVGYLVWSTSGRVDLRYNNYNIANTDDMLTAAESLLVETAAADGAELSPEAPAVISPPTIRARRSRAVRSGSGCRMLIVRGWSPAFAINSTTTAPSAR